MHVAAAAADAYSASIGERVAAASTMEHCMDRKINFVLAAVAVGSIALMVFLSIHGMNERTRAREIARLPVTTFETVTIVGERPTEAAQSTRVAGTQGDRTAPKGTLIR